MDLINLIGFYAIGYAAISIFALLVGLVLSFISVPILRFISEVNYGYIIKAIIGILNSFFLINFLEFTNNKFSNISILSQAVFIFIICTFMFYFLADKYKNLNEKNLDDQTLHFHLNMFGIESIFMVFTILYSILTSIFSFNLLDLSRIFSLIPDGLKYLNYFAFAVFMWIYSRYFLALIISGYWGLQRIKNK
jgi:hypothetical protein